VATQLSESDAAVSTTINIGDSFTIDLNENPTTGYRWELEFDDSMLELRQDHYQTHSGAMIGGGGRRQWMFVATTLGATSLRFKLCRGWEVESTALQQLIFEVLIVKSPGLF
jgi:inhibitor of cysteine peptidase